MANATLIAERVVELPATAAAAGIARREIAATPGLAGELGYKVLLLSSEVISVVVAGAEGRPDRVLRLSITVAREHVRIDVAGHAPEVPADALLRSRETPSLGGYGLRIVDRLADAWGVEDAGAARIWFQLSR